MGLMPEGAELLPLFRRIDRGKKRGQYFRSEGIGYSKMSECVKAALVAIGEDPKRYGLHSFRSGGATKVASRPDFDPRGLEEHGVWAPSSGNMPGYIEDSVMVVPNLLALCVAAVSAVQFGSELSCLFSSVEFQTCNVYEMLDVRCWCLAYFIYLTNTKYLITGQNYTSKIMDGFTLSGRELSNDSPLHLYLQVRGMLSLLQIFFFIV